MKKKKYNKYPDFDLIETSHILDSIWIKKDKTEIKIVFAIGKTLSFRPLKEGEKSL
jgi:hypothetical protein